MDSLHLIDAIGPFFRDYDRRTINWSKIPWAHVDTQTAGPDAESWWSRVRADFEVICQKASDWGFDALSIDDVAHLADHDWLEPEVRSKIARYQKEFRHLFAIAERHGLAVYVTMDVFSATPGLQQRLETDRVHPNAYLAALLPAFFETFPQVRGIISRIGESDGKDVRDDFHSQLVIQTPKQARQLLNDILPVFEKAQRRLVFRTWTVGAYPIGDLMWNRRTFKETFDGITSPALVISMKFGDSDFFRFLPLNKNFFRTKIPKIIELQTRREYEGCGEYPSFVGWDYERYVRELKQAENVIGCMVWSQTGGWVPFRRFAMLDPEAVWTDINTFVTIQVVKKRLLVEQAVRLYAQKNGIADSGALLELLRLSDEVIRELLYTEEFARQKLYFRRVRIPPTLQVYWGNIFISHSVRKLMRHFVQDPETALRSAARCLDLLDRMKELAADCGLPVEDIEYMKDTFEILALAREYYFLPFTEELQQRLRDAKSNYKQKYPKRGLRARYRIKMDFKPLILNRRHLSWAIQLLMRRRRGYRMVDRIVTLNLLSLVYRVIAKRRPHWIPQFARDSAMGVDVVFR